MGVNWDYVKHILDICTVMNVHNLSYVSNIWIYILSSTFPWMHVVSIDPIARSMEAQTRQNSPRQWRRDVLVQEKEHERGLNRRARFFLCRTAGARSTLIFRRRAPRVRPLELFERVQAVTDGTTHFDESRAISVDARFVHPGFAELKKFGRLADRKQLIKI